jgi:hypothetical protein
MQKAIAVCTMVACVIHKFLMTISRRYANVYAVEKCVVGCRRGPFQWQYFHSVEDK